MGDNLFLLLQTAIANNIAQEPPERAKHYDFLKEMLLKRYKLIQAESRKIDVLNIYFNE